MSNAELHEYYSEIMHDLSPEKVQAGIKLMEELAKAEFSTENEGWLTGEDVERELGLQ